MGENLIWGEIDGKWGLVVSAPQPQTFTGQNPFTAPLNKEWVGLTDEEINLIYAQPQTHAGQYARAIEAKLKEKNI